MAKIRPDSRPGEHSAHGESKIWVEVKAGQPTLLAQAAQAHALPFSLSLYIFFQKVHSERPAGEPLLAWHWHLHTAHPRLCPTLDPGSKTRSPLA